jgi:hypothetical protein
VQEKLIHPSGRKMKEAEFLEVSSPLRRNRQLLFPALLSESGGPLR